jgi:hypothetical protein
MIAYGVFLRVFNNCVHTVAQSRIHCMFNMCPVVMGYGGNYILSSYVIFVIFILCVIDFMILTFDVCKRECEKPMRL